MTTADEHLVDHLLALVRWIDQTERITQEISHERFRDDVIGQLALCKSIEQCGEISIRIIKRWPDFVAANSDIEFKQAQATRHRIAHGYDSLNLDLVWFTATTSIPRMGQAVKRVLSRIAPHEQS